MQLMSGAVTFAVIVCTASSAYAEKFRRLNGPQIQAAFSGMEISDNVHWRDFYERSGTFSSSSMGKKRSGKWWVKGNELCIDRGKDDGGCYEVWISGKNVEFRRPGLDAPILDGVLRTPIKGD